jgi:hypothetical protein
MALPQVAVGGDGLQIWRVAANILNKQSRTADRRWPSNLWVRRVLTTPIVKKQCHETFYKASCLDEFFGTTDARGNGHETWKVEC